MKIETNNDTYISNKLITWYQTNRRELPWRETTNPYIIWISEIILQQTRVAQGLDYFNRFVARFPNVQALAEASEDEVLKYWQGLGYYSRARNLHAAAKTIMQQFGGKFPTDYSDVKSLKGIGDYTAAAIVSFAWNKPYAVVDGNVYRVLSRLFAIETPIDTTQGKKVFAELASSLLSHQQAGLHNQAIMELGALQCISSKMYRIIQRSKARLKHVTVISITYTLYIRNKLPGFRKDKMMIFGKVCISFR